MAGKFFHYHDFKKGHIETELGKDEVFFYATQTGLEKLSALLLELAKDTSKHHVSLREQGLLSSESSLDGYFEVFDDR